MKYICIDDKGQGYVKEGCVYDLIEVEFGKYQTRMRFSDGICSYAYLYPHRFVKVKLELNKNTEVL